MNTPLIYSFVLYLIPFVSAYSDYCEDGTFKADPDSCDHFLKCDHGSYVKFACGPGTWFNPKFNNCDYPYNVECAVNGKGHNSGGKHGNGYGYHPETYNGGQNKGQEGEGKHKPNIDDMYNKNNNHHKGYDDNNHWK